MSDAHHRLTYGETTIDYELCYARRKTLEIAVYPELRVVGELHLEPGNERATS